MAADWTSMIRSAGIFIHHRHQDNDPTSLVNDNIHAVMQDSKGRLWMGRTGVVWTYTIINGQVFSLSSYTRQE